MESMITCTTWVPRGFAAQHPRRIQLDEAEYDRIAELAQMQLEDAQDELADAKEGKPEGEDAEDVDMEVDAVEGSGSSKKEESTVDKETKEKDDDDLREYNLDDYDEPTAEEKLTGQSMGMFGNIKALAYHEPGEDDPYITMKDEDDEEERDELQILPTDNILLVGKVEDEVAHLEVYVYEDADDNLYVHHDIMLPAIPLCLEWLDVPVNATAGAAHGNFVAVGTTDPDIEIWDLDVVDSMFPNAILGAGGDEKAAKKAKKKKKRANDKYHVGAVQALSGNRQHRNLLASGSADKTLKLWDLTTTKCVKSYDYHTDQVCTLAWHPKEATSILSGSYDHTIVWADMRAPDAKQPRWGVESDVEMVKWDQHNTNYFYVSTEAGLVHFYDTRNVPATPAEGKPVWTLQAHDKAVSSFDINPIIPGFLATGSMDKTVKLWNTQSSTGGPTMVVSRDMDVGKVFSCVFAPDQEVGFRLSVAGSKGLVTVWDTSTNPGVRRTFADRTKFKEVDPAKEDRTVIAGRADSDDESDDSEDDEEMNEDAHSGDEQHPDGWESN